MWNVGFLATVLVAASAADIEPFLNEVYISNVGAVSMLNAHETHLIKSIDSQDGLISIESLLNNTVAIYTPSEVLPHNITVTYLHKGLRSIYKDPAFKELGEFLQRTDLRSRLFLPKGIHNPKLSESYIKSIIIPSDYKVSVSLLILAKLDSVPIMFIAPQDIYDTYNFPASTLIGTLSVFKNNTISAA